MTLRSDERRRFEDEGYLLLPEGFTAQEIDALRAETSRLATADRPQRVLEADGETVRSIYHVHELSDLFGRLVRDRRVLDVARSLVGGDVYIYQTQLNPKAPLKGDQWEWHQDYVVWQRDDGLPRPDIVNVAVFLDDVTQFNGPVFVVPGSHRLSLDRETQNTTEGWESTLSGVRHKVEVEAMARLVDRHGLAAAAGPRGSVLAFHACLLHASQPNLTPYPRTVLFIRYCRVDNVCRPQADPRPEWLASRRPVALQPLAEPLLGTPEPAPAASAGALAPAQVDAYRRQGFLLLHGVFDADEVAAMRAALALELDREGPQRVVEEDGQHVRAVYGCHHTQPVFEALVRSTRLLGPARQLVGPDLYVYQFKINTKRAFGGEAWSWHQDFIVWHVVDGLPEARTVNAVIFLDDVNEFNGPMIAIPGTQALGAGTGATGGSADAADHVDPSDFSVGPAELDELVRQHGMASLKGQAGSVLYFHPELIHGSAVNISPYSRDLAFVTYNDVANRPRAIEPRPEYLVGRETEPLTPVAGALPSGAIAAVRA